MMKTTHLVESEVDTPAAVSCQVQATFTSLWTSDEVVTSSLHPALRSRTARIQLAPWSFKFYLPKNCIDSRCGATGHASRRSSAHMPSFPAFFQKVLLRF